MSRKGGLQLMWTALKSLAIRPNSKKVFVGRDNFGNKYYEIPEDPVKGVKFRRSLVAVDTDPTHHPNIPSEWTAWLQRRRNSPPSEEEIERNYHTMVKTQARALEKEYIRELEDEKDEKVTKVTPDRAKREFPKYDDMEGSPGQFREKILGEKEKGS